MRVIGGKAKGHKLKMVPGDSTRPITDRVKENLFNILGDWVIDTTWLDLFAGTGQVGIEALSRGAEHVVFVDSARSAVRIIKDNLAHTRFTPFAAVIQRDAFNYLKSSKPEPFDVVYIAPPQYQGLWKEVLEQIDSTRAQLLNREGIAIVQIDPAEYESMDLNSLNLYDKRKYGRTLLSFYEKVIITPPQEG